MKKVLCVLLCVLLVLPLAACKKGGDPSAIFINTESTTESPNDIKDTVKVNFPLSVVEEEFRNDLDAFCEKYGYKSAKLNSDGTVTIKMSAFSRDLLLTQKGMEAIRAIYNVAESGDYPYVKGIKSYDDEDFEEVSVLVDGEKYKSAADTADMAFEIAKGCYVYQVFTGNAFSCTVTVIDKKTKETITEREFTDNDIMTAN